MIGWTIYKIRWRNYKIYKKKKIYIELSGGINMSNLNSYCIDGVDGISMGALTHNIKSKDISLDLKWNIKKQTF